MELSSVVHGVFMLELAVFLVFPTSEAVEFYSLGGIFDDGPPPNPERMIFVQSSIRNNIRSNSSSSSRPFHAAARLQHTKLENNAAVLRKMCVVLAYNVSLTVGMVDFNVANMVASTSQQIQVPFITPSFASKESFPDMDFDYVISMRPSLIQPLLDLLEYHKWKDFAYIYDGQRGLRRSDTFMQMFPQYGYNVVFKNLLKDRNITETLKSMAELGNHLVVFDLSLENSVEVLRKANGLGMVTASYHYIFMDLDISEMNLTEFQAGGLNITGFRLLDKNSDAYQDFIWEWRSYVKNSSYQEVDINYFHLSNPALSVDMMDVALEALDLYRMDPSSNIKRKEKSLSCNLGSSSRVIPNPDGPNLKEVIKKVKLQGLTGNIEFDSDGNRANYSLQILGLRGKTLMKVGTWNGANKQRLTFDSQGDTEAPINPGVGRMYTITSILNPPFLMRKPGGKPNEYQGYCVDLLIEIARVYRGPKFNYKIELVSDSEFGSQMANGKWNGMIGELMYGKADIAVAPLTINVQRERTIGFTKPFMSVGVSIMIKKPMDNKPSVFAFMQPLAPEIWMCVIFACCIVSVVLFQVSRFSPKEWHRVDHPPSTPSGTGDYSSEKPGERFVTEDQEETENDFGIFNSLWFTVGALMQQGCELCPRSMSGRLTGGVWWFFTLIIVSSYTANLAAFLTAKRMVMPISSASDLVDQTAITYGILKSGSSQTFFQTSTVPLYRHMWEFMRNSEGSPFANTTQEGVERVRKSNGKYAFLLESAMNDYYNSQPPCDTMMVGSLLDSKSYGIGVSKHLVEVRELLTLAILELREQATLDTLQKKWWSGNGSSSCKVQKVPEHLQKTSALNLETLAGVFYILLGGLAGALLVAGIHLFWRSRHEIIAAKDRYLQARRELLPESKKQTLPMNKGAQSKSSGTGSHTV
ncbi:glutamate receptor 2-like [Asterias amurensis]|uniref:glutamate receptor 2-like n=1 Tax=Asterias amurensis TaxID=7602 RepID=UPI003AB687A6